MSEFIYAIKIKYDHHWGWLVSRNRFLKDKFTFFQIIGLPLTQIKERKLDHPLLQGFFEGFKTFLEDEKHMVLAWVHPT